MAFSTYRVARLLHLDVRAAVRGALLHDLYLYDSKDKHRIKKFPMRYSSNRDANVGFEKL